MSSEPQTSSQALLSAPLLSSVDDEACCELVGDHLRPDAVVFFITITQSPTDRLSVYREYGPDDIDVRFELVAVDNQNTTAELDEDAVREAGEDINITTVRSARDLTRLGLAINKRIREIDDDQPVVVCFHSLTSLLQFVDQDIAFRFIHTLNGVVESYNGSIHYHIDANAHSQEVMGTFRPLFDTVVDGDDMIRTKRDMEKARETTQRPPAIELEPSTDAEGRATDSTSASGASDRSDEFEDMGSFSLDVEEVSDSIGESTATEAESTAEADTEVAIDSEPDAEFDTVFDPEAMTSAADVESAGDADEFSAPATDSQSAAASTESTTSPDTATDPSTPGSGPLPTDSDGTVDNTTPSKTNDASSPPKANKPLPELDTTSTTTSSEPSPAYDSAIGEAEARALLGTDRHRLAEGYFSPEAIRSETTTETVADSTSSDTLEEWEWADSKSAPDVAVSTESASATETTERVDSHTPTHTEQASTTEENHSVASDRSGTETQSAVEATPDSQATVTIDLGFIAQTVLGVLLLVGGLALLMQGEVLLAGVGVSITAVLPAVVSLPLVGGVIAGLGVLVLFLR